MMPPRIGITLGDPGGVGPEIVLKAIQKRSSLPEGSFILFGSHEVFETQKKLLSWQDKDAVEYSFIDIETRFSEIKTGEPAQENGRLAFSSFIKAVEMARSRSLDAIVTAPISKHSWNLAGIKWAGHTEYLHSMYPEAIMSFFSKNLNVALFSHHLPLKKALRRVNKKSLENFFFLLHKHIRKIGKKQYRYFVAGLNPHAGESGMLGREEEKEIMPAVEAARKKGIPIDGPFPADVIFRMARSHSDNIVIALYHDQGLIAFKLDSFYTGVNVTLGLPFVRTSPDHGTAFDIAGKNLADPRSMIHAICLACRFAAGQR
jgi:4-hydroxythreonine-4-phosphate dehydrogenase